MISEADIVGMVDEMFSIELKSFQQDLSLLEDVQELRLVHHRIDGMKAKVLQACLVFKDEHPLCSPNELLRVAQRTIRAGM